MEGVVVHRCRRIDPVDMVQRPDGIRLSSPPRTIFDSADMIGFEATTSVLEQLLNEQKVTFGTISDTVHRLYHPQRPGSKTMLAVIRSRPAWRAALQSDLEVKVLEEMSRQNLPVPVTQFPMRLPDRDIVIDFAWPAFKLAVEVDHPAWHDGALDSHADKGRDRKLTTIGWTSTRITAIDVNGGLREAVADIGRILDRLGAPPRDEFPGFTGAHTHHGSSESRPVADLWARQYATSGRNRAQPGFMGATTELTVPESRPTGWASASRAGGATGWRRRLWWRRSATRGRSRSPG